MIFVFYALLLLVVIPFIVIFFIAEHQFNILLVRDSADKWTRRCSDSEDAEQLAMYNEGLEWGNVHSDCMHEVSIKNEGLVLCGQYFDFGFKRAVIIIAGRTEGCIYSYYYGEPYRQAGFNVLVIDNRSHGFSDGYYNSLGFREYKDVLAWGKFLYETMENQEVICHGVCIGSATALYALTDKDCPSYMTGMTADGMYTTFGSSFREHLVQDKRPIFPFFSIFFFIFKCKIGFDAVNDGPVKRMGDMKKRILFLHSREDLFSIPDKTYSMYEKCPSSDKRFEFFDKGRHSYVRHNNLNSYDKAIVDFYR